MTGQICFKDLTAIDLPPSREMNSRVLSLPDMSKRSNRE